MRKLQLAIILLFVLFNLKAQMYVPIDTANCELRKKISETYLVDGKQFIANNYKHLGSGERSFIKKQSKRRDQLVSEQILKGEWVFDPRFDSLISSLVRRIVEANPTIPQNTKFHVVRDLSLNAASIGNGYFLVNIGCFNFLQNENQLASVLSHEIGHLYLSHAEQDYIERYKQETSSDLKETVDDISRQKYNRGEIAKTKLKEILYSNGERNKAQELQADSIGYVFYRNAKFSPPEFIHSLKLMAEYDTIRPKGLNIECYKRLFDLPKQPFKQGWLKKEDFTVYDYSKFKETYNEDSLEDHPETIVRIERLRKLFPELEKSEIINPSTSFAQLQTIAKLEQPSTLYFQKEYGIGLYQCMLQLQDNSQDDYSKKWVAEFLNGITKSRKEYTLNRYLDRINPKKQSESYQQFLSFMWNLSLSELQYITDYYSQKKPL